MDNEKEMIVDSTGKILSEIQDKKFEIVTPAEHREDDKTGWTFSIKTDGGEFVCFAGFIGDEKYEDKFVFEILEGTDTEKFDFLEWDRDDSDNLVVESKNFKKFLNSKNDVRTKDLSKWITEYCKTVTAFFKVGNTDYKKIGFFRRLFMVELPIWFGMSALAGTAELLIPSEETTKGDIIYVIIFDIVAIVIFLATMKFRNKVKDAMGLEWEWKKPWTWFVSYTGKFFGICLIYPIMKILTLVPVIFGFLFSAVPLIFGFLFSAAASSRGGSSYSGSYGGSSGGGSSSASRRQNFPNLNWYLCKECHTLVKQNSSPSSSNCPRGSTHRWTNLGKMGDTNYLCKECGILVQTQNSPSSFNCPSGRTHSWTNLGKIGDKNYQCKECGTVVWAQNSPSSFNCPSGRTHSWTRL